MPMVGMRRRCVTMLAERGRYRLEHYEARAAASRLHCVLDQLLLGVFTFALHAVAAETGAPIAA